MKLYPKKLNSLEDLERERALVEKEARRLNAEDIFSLEGLTGNAKKGAKEETGSGSDLLHTLLQLIPGTNPVISMMMPLITGWMGGNTDRKTRKKQKERREEYETKPNIFRKIAVEVVTGYLKWKALELSYKGMQHFVRRNRERRQADA